MTRPPRVSVQMPAYNSARYVGTAIESVLGQTFRDFELLVIDDGSTDDTASIVRSYADPRIRLTRNERNLGLGEVRSQAVGLARGEYIAFLDSDDVAARQRLDLQVTFLDRHPACGLVGGWARRLDAEGREVGIIRRPTSGKRIRARLLFNYCFKNTTVMARRRLVEEYGFRSEFLVSQDVDLWVRIALDHDAENLPVVLSDYRDHAGGISKRHRRLTRDMRLKIISEQLQRLGIDFDQGDILCHYDVCEPHQAPRTREFLEHAADWLRRLQEANRSARLYPGPEFDRAIGERWLKACVSTAPSRRAAFANLIRWPLLGSASAALLLDRDMPWRRWGFALFGSRDA